MGAASPKLCLPEVRRGAVSATSESPLGQDSAGSSREPRACSDCLRLMPGGLKGSSVLWRGAGWARLPPDRGTAHKEAGASNMARQTPATLPITPIGGEIV